MLQILGFFAKLAVGIVVILTFIRLFGPVVNVCSYEGSGNRKLTVCPGGIVFKGDDLLSPLRVGMR